MMEEKQQYPFFRLLSYGRQHRRQYVLATLFSILNKVFDLAPPALIAAAVDIVVEQQDSLLGKLGVEDVGQQLIILGGVTLIVWIIESITEYIAKVHWRNLAQDIQHEMRMDAYQHVQNLDLAYFEDQSTGKLMSILNDDINQLERFLDMGAHQLITVTVTVVIIGGVFILVAPTVAWMALVPMPIIIWGSMRFQKLLAPRYSAVRDKVGILNSDLSNNLSGIATIKSFTAEDFEAEHIRGKSQEYRETNRRAIQLSTAFSPMIRMLIVSGFIAITLFGGQLALEGRLAIGVYSFMIFMTQRLLWPLTSLGEVFDLYQRAMASTTRILDLLMIEATITDGEHPLPLNKVQGQVVFEDVQFAYSNNIPVMQGLDIHIPAGNTAAIVGSTGAGKSTIIKLLLRFYDVTGGRIRVDGHNIRDLNLYDLRSTIGLVSQDVFLFDGTVKENIAYGTFDASMDEIITAAKIAEVHAFILSLPQGYDTVVGERGQKLSGGQRQRISIARALLKDPPILVLDEATSSVDNETEAAIQRSLEKIVVGRTTIVIAHRLSTVRNADQIFVVEHGKVIEQGLHDELVHADGLYAALWRVQSGMAIRSQKQPIGAAD